MFTIQNKRKQFWQWDTGQRLIVNADVCSEVHFCNGTSDCSLVCEVYEEDGLRLVNVPNILLQVAKPIKVFAYVCDEDDHYTEHMRLFSVAARTKPDNYVYTETEILDYRRYETIARELNAQSKEYADNAGASAAVAKTLEDAAKASETSARKSAGDASAAAAAVTEAKNQAENAAENAGRSAASAAVSETNAAAVAEAAATSERNAALSAERAEQVAAENGYAVFEMGEDGCLYYGRTENIKDLLDFALTEDGELEVYIYA